MISPNLTPMWQGRVVELSGVVNPVAYTVHTESDNTVIYSGRAVPRPRSSRVLIELFDILAPYVHNEMMLEALREAHDGPDAFVRPSLVARRFILTTDTQRTWNMDMVADYSYGRNYYAYPPMRPVLSDPVTAVSRGGNVYLQQGTALIVTSQYVSAGTLRLVQGTGTVVQTWAISGDPRAYNVVIDGGLMAAGSNYHLEFPDGARSNTFYIEDGSCGHRHIDLHYVNAFGGWDVLPMRGICRMTDTFEREEVNVDGYRIDQLTADLNQQRRVSRVDGGVRWELNTGLLTDEQSARFALHVPGTTMAVLQENIPGWVTRFYPVKVVDTEVQTKTVVNNGRAPASYTLTVELLQDLVRL